MTKHVEIWTLSKESKVVPYMTSRVEYAHHSLPDEYVVSDKFYDSVEHRYMDIIQVTKCSAIYGRVEIDSKIERSDKYIAIHPDVDEAISVKWQEKMDELTSDYEDRLNKMYVFAQSEIEVLSAKIEIKNEYLKFIRNLPWYKRVWRAICNEI